MRDEADIVRTCQWKFCPSKPTCRKAGITGYALVDGKFMRLAETASVTAQLLALEAALVA